MIALALQLLGLLTFWTCAFASSVVLLDRFVDPLAEPEPLVLVGVVIATVAAGLLWWLS